ncbi:MAG: IS66 family insertion sequence element accessory protein TnpB [Oligoflexia bacterium]|nr:IS66 family insertion sequence element accessory protein TnpB [Oligoflexia bacterium]
MLINSQITKMFLYRTAIDMRKGHNGLSFLVTHKMNLNLLSGSVFLFISKNRKSAKALLWDGTGLVLIHKKIERIKFMSFSDLQEIQEVSVNELALIFEGAKIKLPLSAKKIEIDLQV